MNCERGTNEPDDTQQARKLQQFDIHGWELVDVFPNPVKYDYRIVDGVTHHGKDSSDESLINL